MSAETLVAVPFHGVQFMVAVDAAGRISDVKLQGKWWPAVNVLSTRLLEELQRTLDAMPLDSEAG
jgi:hypothetical protein